MKEGVGKFLAIALQISLIGGILNFPFQEQIFHFETGLV